jgi:hypothetical protein
MCNVLKLSKLNTLQCDHTALGIFLKKSFPHTKKQRHKSPAQAFLCLKKRFSLIFASTEAVQIFNSA